MITRSDKPYIVQAQPRGVLLAVMAWGLAALIWAVTQYN